MTKNILVVDDEKDISASIKMLIEGIGYKAKTADDGKEALGLLKKEKFDLVLLDILMPGMSGREVAENIRNDPKLKNQKVAFLTVIQPSESGQKAIEKLKPVDYFIKPIDNADFKKRLKKILG